MLDDGGRLVNVFVPLSETRFEAEDADRGFTLIRGEEGRGGVTGMTLRLLADEMPAERIAPLLRPIQPGPDPSPELTHRVEAVLKAFARGGKAVEDVEGVAAQARKDYARGPAPEPAGIARLALLAVRDVSGRGIVRHGADVARVLAYRIFGEGEPRHVPVYVTADGHVTDRDVVTE